MNILEKIVESKKQEVSYQKQVIPLWQLKKYPGYKRNCHSLKAALLHARASGIIAEFKQKSPSKGEINFGVQVEEVTRQYANAGASALSVLTDYEYFGGTLANLSKAREFNPEIPILRKDFILENYQVEESKAFGADVILLIAACLEKEQALQLAKKAKGLGMEVLMEIHSSEELDKVNDLVDMVGVNNRNLKTFEVTIETSVELAKHIPERYTRISESGLLEARSIQYLKKYGYRGFLIGETFMKTSDPGAACKHFISQL